MIHELKTWPLFFKRVLTGQKNFELRKDDRGFEIGDTLNLKEWDPITNEYTGRTVLRRVTYILRGGEFGLEPGYVIMSI
jgi:uncharacterized protein DUF3850